MTLVGPETEGGTIGKAFRASTRAKLMPYMMGGFPEMQVSVELAQAYADAGADLIEVGVPFSDPLADGPVIQAAGEKALGAGATFEGICEQIARPLSSRVPVILMCYINPLLSQGLDHAVGFMSTHGVAGLIVPDLPAREAGELRTVCDQLGVSLVPLVAPTTPPEEVDWIASVARGFVYVVSTTGVTGERRELPPELGRVVERVKSAASVPVAVGFGVGTPQQAAEVGEIADGVIVGSRLVRALGDAPDPGQGVADAARLVGEMASALSV